MDRGAWRATVGHTDLDTTERLSTHIFWEPSSEVQIGFLCGFLRLS